MGARADNHAYQGSRGDIDFDLTISNTDNIIAKVADWRKQQKIEVRGAVPHSSDNSVRSAVA